MGLVTSLKNWGTKCVRGVIKAVECTCEVCESAFKWGKEKCHEIGEKIKEWQTNKPASDPVPEEVRVNHQPSIQEAKKRVQQKFPNGIKTECERMSPEERKTKIEEIAEEAIKILDIKDPPEIVMEIPEEESKMWTSYGSYCHSTNQLRLNLAMIVTDNPQLYQEQISTVFHEMIHARQLRAIEALAEDRLDESYGYSENYVANLTYNLKHYIRPSEIALLFFFYPLEAEAFWYEQELGLTTLN